MAKRRYNNINNVIKWRVKEGRGQGRGDNYLPWVYTQDLSSKGCDHRKQGLLHNRPLHALSNLESNFIDILQWSSECVTEIREQYPLDLEETTAIAHELNIRHPHQHGVEVPLTTDVLVTLRNGLMTEDQPWTLKYSKDLEDLKKGRRTFEKFEIERVYWSRRGKKLLIVTEREIPLVATKNINHFNAYRTIENRGDASQHITFLAPILTEAVRKGDTLINITEYLDLEYGLSQGTALTIAYHLIATHQWRINISTPFEPHNRLTLLDVNLISVLAETTK